MKRIVLAWGFALACILPAFAQDGEDVIFHDALLDKMAGSWTMTGTIAGAPTTHKVEVRWVLNHQFLQIHEVSIEAKPDGTPQYEAMPMIGYDNTDKRYVVHWIDTFGGRYSETLGYGVREGDEIKFVFEYPEGSFNTIFRWNEAAGTWQWLMEQKDEKGQWAEFGNMTMSRNGD